jgi:hypothetical protein
MMVGHNRIEVLFRNLRIGGRHSANGRLLVGKYGEANMTYGTPVNRKYASCARAVMRNFKRI